MFFFCITLNIEDKNCGTFRNQHAKNSPKINIRNFASNLQFTGKIHLISKKLPRNKFD